MKKIKGSSRYFFGSSLACFFLFNNRFILLILKAYFSRMVENLRQKEIERLRDTFRKHFEGLLNFKKIFGYETIGSVALNIIDLFEISCNLDHLFDFIWFYLILCSSYLLCYRFIRRVDILPIISIPSLFRYLVPFWTGLFSQIYAKFRHLNVY